MNVYLLNISIYPKFEERSREEVVNVARLKYSDVFFSMDKAVNAGAKKLAEWLERLREIMFMDESIGDIANDDVCYDFYVYEFDPAAKRTSQGKWEQYARWDYNYKGEAVYRQEILQCPDLDTDEKRLTGWMWRSGDEKEDAGTIFKLGDYVKLGSNHHHYYDLKDMVFVIGETPSKKSDSNVWENTYALYFIGKDAKFYHTVAHETEIIVYNGDIPAENPLQMLKKIATGEVKVSPETWEDINNQRIMFDWQGGTRSWRNIGVS